MSRRGSPDAGAPYHRLGRTPRTRWWRSILSLLCLNAVAAILVLAALYLLESAHEPAPELEQASRFDQLWELGSALVLLWLAVPAVVLTVRRVERRPAGAIASVAGRVRWRWLGTCVAASGAIAVSAGCAIAIVDPPAGGLGQVDWALLGAVTATAVVLVPLQAAGEEVLFRGYLAQAIGAYVRGPWLPAIAISMLFGLWHGSVADQGTWLFADRVGFGLIAAWLVIRTGGLEAAIALHAVSNVVALDLLAIDGELVDFLVGDEAPVVALDAILDLAALTVTALVLVRLARRRGLETAWPAREPAVKPSAAEARP